jgi:hypothetical protein
MRIKVRHKKGPGGPWIALGDVTASPSAPANLPPAPAAESDLFSLQLIPEAGDRPAIRIFVGSVLAASTLGVDRVVVIDYDDDSDSAPPPLVCRGKLLADWVGITELVVQVRPDGTAEWHKLLTLPLAISAGKLAAEQFDQLFRDLERESAAVLLDVHGKTSLGLKGGQPLASAAPLAVLGRLRETIREMAHLLQRIARQPASRLRTTLIREQALAGQAISDDTLAEACRDPGMLGRIDNSIRFREHLRERSHADYRIAEHQAIADFAEYLKSQLNDLRQRIDVEVAERTDRKRWRSHARGPDTATWWESEDLPRIDELQRCREEVQHLHASVVKWGALPFLPPGGELRQRPQSTPLFRNHPIYRRVFRVIAGHFLFYQATLDVQPLMTRARSLPVLYEWWCAVRVIGTLSRLLLPQAHDPLSRPIISTHLAREGKRFTIEFSPNQVISFTDGHGCRVRFRYQPEYHAARLPPGPTCGVLDAAAIRTPDMAIEVFRPHSPADLPDLIIVLDAKYSSQSQAEKMTEVTTKYAKIGDGRTGRILSRQVWALTPAAPAHAALREGLAQYCTVDNVAFWSAEFDANNPVNGAVQARPVAHGAFDPIHTLIATLLKLSGVACSTDPNVQPPDRVP